MSVSTRTVAILLLLVLGVAVACRLFDTQSAGVTALTMVTAVLAIAVIPGALITLAWLPRGPLTILEIVGFGIALSAGVVQILTVAAITFHLAPAAMVAVLFAGCLALAAIVVVKNESTVHVHADEVLVLALLAVLSASLYLLGSPVTSSEDQIHAAVVRRLADLTAPALDNIYFVSDIVFTYPFPGTHYLMALVATVAGLDPLFAYHKLRFFWGPAALVLLYLSAQTMFGGRPMAAAVTATAVVLTCAGVFAMVPEFSWGWGQLATYSHPSDIAMSVLLPALLVMSFEYVHAETRRADTFFLMGAGLLTFMLAAVHVREAVQFIVYFACFLAVSAFVPRFRRYARRAAVLVVLALVVTSAYAVWLEGVDPLYGDVLEERRADLVAVVTDTPVTELLRSSASSVIGDYLPEIEHIRDGLTPVFLFAGPLVIVLFRDRPLI